MDIITRQNKVLDYMKKNESHQEWNRWLFICSLGIILHTLSCINNTKKLKPVDYAGIPMLVLSVKRAHTLNKREEKGQNLWHILQKKSISKE